MIQLCWNCLLEAVDGGSDSTWWPNDTQSNGLPGNESKLHATVHLCVHTNLFCWVYTTWLDEDYIGRAAWLNCISYIWRCNMMFFGCRWPGCPDVATAGRYVLEQCEELSCTTSGNGRSKVGWCKQAGFWDIWSGVYTCAHICWWQAGHWNAESWDDNIILLGTQVTRYVQLAVAVFCETTYVSSLNIFYSISRTCIPPCS